MPEQPTIALRDGHAIPQLGFGVFQIRVTRPYFDAGPSSTDEEIAAEVPRHPVFRLVPR